MSENTGDQSKQNKYLIFQLNELLLGIDIINVIEIIEYQPTTKVPGAPLFMHGLLNLRGNVIPVIDFGLYLEQESTVISKKTCIVLLEYTIKNQTVKLGILVDNVLDVIEIMPNKLEKAAALGTQIKTEFIKNMFILDNRIIIILDLTRVFPNQEFKNQEHQI